ncbi:MAG: SMI1/KNR4 family protein [Polyangiaceae bacterium]
MDLDATIATSGDSKLRSVTFDGSLLTLHLENSDDVNIVVRTQVAALISDRSEFHVCHLHWDDLSELDTQHGDVMLLVDSILEKLRADPSVVLLPARGLPSLRRGHVLPDDLRAFYSACGGLELGRDSSYAMRVVTPSEFVSANLEIVGEDVPDDISDSWYVLCRGAGDQLLTIDCSPQRLGRCHDSYWEVHGLAGSCAVVEQSFGQLLTRLVSSAGKRWFWLEDDFEPLGDAYD